MGRLLKIPPRYPWPPYLKPIIKLGTIRTPRHFDWKHLKYIKESMSWAVQVINWEDTRTFVFDTEAKANEFAMLKKLEE
jgi:hypothetical protein